MPQVQQVLKYSHEEIKNILIDKAKNDFSENGGKLVQGRSVVEFAFDPEKRAVDAVVSFERAGK